MDSRVAVVAILVENQECSQKINEILHQYASYVIGRMGIPYAKKKISVICVVVDAPQNEIAALSGKLGRIRGVSTKVLYSRQEEKHV